MTKRLDVQKLRVGEWLFEVQYYEVIKIKEDTGDVVLRNNRGYNFEVTPEVVEEGMISATQFESEQDVTRTELIDILERAGATIFTVCFFKQPKEKDVLDETLAVLRQEVGQVDLPTLEKHVKQAIKRSIHGEERIIVGHLIQSEPKMGRSQVVDLSVPHTEHSIRLVDHRSLQWMILRGVKYVVR